MAETKGHITRAAALWGMTRPRPFSTRQTVRLRCSLGGLLMIGMLSKCFIAIVMLGAPECAGCAAEGIAADANPSAASFGLEAAESANQGSDVGCARVAWSVASGCSDRWSSIRRPWQRRLGVASSLAVARLERFAALTRRLRESALSGRPSPLGRGDSRGCRRALSSHL